MVTPSNVKTIQQEIDWLASVIDEVIQTYLMQDGHENNWLDLPMPDLSANPSPYAEMAAKWKLNAYGRLALALAMAPHIRPEALDVFLIKNQTYDRGFTEFGGTTDKNHSGFLPTGQTLCFLIASGNPQLLVEAMNAIGPHSILIQEQVLTLTPTEDHISKLNGILSINNNWMNYFLTGEKTGIEYNAPFSAQKITTHLEWEDLVLDGYVLEQVEEVLTWLQHSEVLLNDWDLSKKIKPGFRALFYGPPGTGKTLTATLIGKTSQRDVYRVDLSMVVSKYIGETEKNLAKIFDIAQQKNWILYFDEADALFGKRTATQSSNDRHANQQTAYFLQRIEDFQGTVILATNLRANMNEAFLSIFQSVIHFNLPSAEKRYQLWKNAFSGKCTLDTDIDLTAIAEKYEVTGGAITNILRFCALSAVRRNSTVAGKNELLKGLRREFHKENKTLPL